MKKSNAEKLIEAGLVSEGELSEEDKNALEHVSEAEINAVISGGKKLKAASPGKAIIRTGF